MDQGTSFRSQFSSKTSVQPSCESFYISYTTRLPYDEGELRRPENVIGLKTHPDVVVQLKPKVLLENGITNYFELQSNKETCLNYRI